MSGTFIVLFMTFCFLFFGYLGVPVAFSLLAGVLLGAMFTDVSHTALIQKMFDGMDSEALLALFAEDATLTHPVGTDHGHTEIADFHNDVVFAGQLHMTIVRRIEQGNVEVVQLQGTSPLNDDDTTVQTVDIFTLNDDGLVQALDIYYR